jgi:uncharacterized protein YgiM (DUF1202 family)
VKKTTRSGLRKKGGHNFLCPKRTLETTYKKAGNLIPMRRLTATLCLTLAALLGSEVKGSDMPVCDGSPQITTEMMGLEWRDPAFIKSWSNCIGSVSQGGGTVYVGEWLDGRRHGLGIQKYFSGRIQEGAWVKGVFQHAQIVSPFVTAQSSIKSSSVVNKCAGSPTLKHERLESWINCNGIFISSKLRKYSYINGNLTPIPGDNPNKNVPSRATKELLEIARKNDREFSLKHKSTAELENKRQHGKGTFTFADGSKYVGEFKDGNFHGQGTFTFADGSKYVGEFKDDNFHGPGTLTAANGKVQEGIWKNDEFQYAQKVSPTLTARKSSSPSKTGAVVFGTLVNPITGDKYVGEWKNGRRHGKGTLTYADGRVKEGIWKDNKFQDAPKVSSNVTATKTSPTPKSDAEKEIERLRKENARLKKRQQSLPKSVNNETVFWQSIADSDRAGDYQTYLSQYPSGAFAALALSRLSGLREQQAAALSPPSFTVEAMDETLVALRSANMRERPTASSAKLATLKSGSVVEVTGKTQFEGKDWYRVAFKGRTAFVFGTLLGPKPAVMKPPPVAELRQRYSKPSGDAGEADGIARGPSSEQPRPQYYYLSLPLSEIGNYTNIKSSDSWLGHRGQRIVRFSKQKIILTSNFSNRCDLSITFPKSAREHHTPYEPKTKCHLVRSDYKLEPHKQISGCADIQIIGRDYVCVRETHDKNSTLFTEYPGWKSWFVEPGRRLQGVYFTPEWPFKSDPLLDKSKESNHPCSFNPLYVADTVRYSRGKTAKIYELRSQKGEYVLPNLKQIGWPRGASLPKKITAEFSRSSPASPGNAFPERKTVSWMLKKNEPLPKDLRSAMGIEKAKKHFLPVKIDDDLLPQDPRAKFMLFDSHKACKTGEKTNKTNWRPYHEGDLSGLAAHKCSYAKVRQGDRDISNCMLPIRKGKNWVYRLAGS